MQLKGITIENFHNFDYKSLSFTKGLNLLVAPNQRGKSTVIEAIKLLLVNGDNHQSVTSRARLILYYIEKNHAIEYMISRTLAQTKGRLFAQEKCIDHHFTTYTNDDLDMMAILTNSYHMTHQIINQPQYDAFCTQWQTVLVRTIMPQNLQDIDSYIIRLKKESKQLYTKHAHSKSDIVKLEQALHLQYKKRDMINKQAVQAQQMFTEYVNLELELNDFKQSIENLYSIRDLLIKALPYVEKKERLDRLDKQIKYEQMSEKANDINYLKRQTLSDEMLNLSKQILEVQTAKHDNQRQHKAEIKRQGIIACSLSVMINLGHYIIFGTSSLNINFQFYLISLFLSLITIFGLIFYGKFIEYKQSMRDINLHQTSLHKKFNTAQLGAADLDTKLAAIYQTTSLDKIGEIISRAKRDLLERETLKNEQYQQTTIYQSIGQINAELEHNNFKILDGEREYNQKKVRFEELKNKLDKMPSGELMDIELNIVDLKQQINTKKEKLLLMTSMLSVFECVKSIYSVNQSPVYINNLNSIVMELSDEELSNVVLKENGEITLTNIHGSQLSVGQLSTGAFNLLLFAQKLALLNYFDPKFQLPLLIDDAFMSLDDARKIRVHKYLLDIALYRQIIYALTKTDAIFDDAKNINIITL